MMTGDTTGASGGDNAQTLPSHPRESELSHVLSAISHEIKNPLASLKLNAQMLTRAIERGQTPRIESAQLLTQAVDQLDQIASELSDAVRAESDRFELKLKPTDLSALIRQAAADADATYKRSITVNLPPAALLAQADEVRIRQVLHYILANAASYTPQPGAITLAARRTGGTIRVEIRDEGVGIAERDQPYVFDAFYRGTQATQLQAQTGAGLGLGLYIARCIVHRHTGKIGVISAPGKGTTIWFTLPRTVCS